MPSYVYICAHAPSYHPSIYPTALSTWIAAVNAINVSVLLDKTMYMYEYMCQVLPILLMFSLSLQPSSSSSTTNVAWHKKQQQPILLLAAATATADADAHRASIHRLAFVPLCG